MKTEKKRTIVEAEDQFRTEFLKEGPSKEAMAFVKSLAMNKRQVLPDVLITPDIAKAIWVKNLENRQLRSFRVVELAAMMRAAAGKTAKTGDVWKDSVSDPLRFHKKGMQINGQHSMAALIVSGTAHRFILVTGHDDEDFDLLDNIEKRTIHDKNYHKSKGAIKRPSTTSVLRMVFMMETGRTWDSEISKRTTSEQYTEFYCDNKEVVDKAMSWTDKIAKKIGRGTKRQIVGASYVRFALKSREKAESFFGDLEGTKRSSLIIHPAIKTLESALYKNKDESSKLSTTDYAIIFARAWNAYRGGPKLSLNIVKGEKIPELLR